MKANGKSGTQEFPMPRGSRGEGVLPKLRSVPVLGHSNVETNATVGFFVCPSDGMRAVFSAFVFGQHTRDEALTNVACRRPVLNPVPSVLSQPPIPPLPWGEGLPARHSFSGGGGEGEAAKRLAINPGWSKFPTPVAAPALFSLRSLRFLRKLASQPVMATLHVHLPMATREASWSAPALSAPYAHLSVSIAKAGTDRLFCGGGPVRHSLGDGGRPACRLVRRSFSEGGSWRHLAAWSGARVSTELANNSTFPGRGALFRRAGRPALRQAGCPPLPKDAYKVQSPLALFAVQPPDRLGASPRPPSFFHEHSLSCFSGQVDVLRLNKHSIL